MQFHDIDYTDISMDEPQDNNSSDEFHDNNSSDEFHDNNSSDEFVIQDIQDILNDELDIPDIMGNLSEGNKINNNLNN
jgi:hypothetical protein